MFGADLIRDHGRLLAFSFVLCFFSSYGQTFFIGVFGGELRAEFDLDDGAWGAAYSQVTLVSGLLLLGFGHLVDRYDLRRCALVVCLGLGAAALGMGLAVNWWQVCLALFGLRLFGQGLMGHVAMTAVARYIVWRRARAVSLAALGVGLGGILWPRLGVGLLDRFDRQAIWISLAGFLLLVVLPLVFWSLRGHGAQHAAHLQDIQAQRDEGPAQRQ